MKRHIIQYGKREQPQNRHKLVLIPVDSDKENSWLGPIQGGPNSGLVFISSGFNSPTLLTIYLINSPYSSLHADK